MCLFSSVNSASVFPLFHHRPLFVSSLINQPPSCLGNLFDFASLFHPRSPSCSVRRPVLAPDPPTSFHSALMLTGCCVFYLLTVPKQRKRANLSFSMAGLSLNSSSAQPQGPIQEFDKS